MNNEIMELKRFKVHKRRKRFPELLFRRFPGSSDFWRVTLRFAVSIFR